jgi:hypothetical protein
MRMWAAATASWPILCPNSSPSFLVVAEQVSVASGRCRAGIALLKGESRSG